MLLPPLGLGCAGKKTKKPHDQWVEDCVYERTLPRDQCETLWEDAHTDKK
jgi:hypothetical protein